MSASNETTIENVQKIPTNIPPVGHQEDLTDLGNSKRLVRLGQGKIVFIRESKKWYGWSGHRWEEDHKGLLPTIEEMLKELKQEHAVYAQLITERMKELFGDVPFTSDSVKESMKTDATLKTLAEDQKQSQRWHLASQAKARIDACIALAQKDLSVTKSITQFDSKGQFVGTLNGVVNLATGKFVTNDPEYLITKNVNANYDPEALCTNWDTNLLTYMNGDAEAVKLVQKIAGVALSGFEKDKMFFWIGTGDNGKSTIQKTLGRLFHTYSGSTDGRVITSHDGKSEYYKAEMVGKRLINIAETREDAHLAGALVKECIESGMITGRAPGGVPFEFQPIFTGVVSTNWLPQIGDDSAVWKRIITIRWGYTIPADKKDAKFIDKFFVPEFSGILNWAIKGYQLYMAEGWAVPESVKAYNKEDQVDQDKLQTFIDLYCIVDEKVSANFASEIDAMAFRNLYKQWCDISGVNAEGSKTLNEKLRKKGFRVEKHKRQMTIFGLKFPLEITRASNLNVMLDQLETSATKLELRVVKTNAKPFKSEMLS
jgi:putative DNA primase/helicase